MPRPEGNPKEEIWAVLVDDEPSILKALQRELRPWSRQTGCSLAAAASGEEALELIRRKEQPPASRVALVLTDQRMPGMSGGELLLALQKEAPHIPALVLTGYADVKEMRQAIQAQAYAYLFKPWEPETLLQEVNKVFRIDQDRREKNRYLQTLKEELSWAGELQKALLSGDLPRDPALTFEITYRPLPELFCGGDYYDIIPLAERRYLALVADVAGHGVKAAFITTILKSIIYRGYIRKHREGPFSPADFLAWLNRRLIKELRDLPDMLVTMAAVLVDPVRGQIILGSAGHNPCGLLRKGKWHSLHTQGSGLGIFEEAPYRNSRLTLEPGDWLLVYTDGLVELSKQAEENDERPLTEAVQRLVPQGGPETHQQIISAVLEAQGQQEFSDDVTLLSLTYHPNKTIDPGKPPREEPPHG